MRVLIAEEETRATPAHRGHFSPTTWSYRAPLSEYRDPRFCELSSPSYCPLSHPALPLGTETKTFSETKKSEVETSENVHVQRAISGLEASIRGGTFRDTWEREWRRKTRTGVRGGCRSERRWKCPTNDGHRRPEPLCLLNCCSLHSPYSYSSLLDYQSYSLARTLR